MERSTRALLTGILAATIVMCVARAAFATFPGANGRLAYNDIVGTPGDPTAYTSIFLTGAGPVIAAPDGGGSFMFPAWSPDGSQLAYVHSDFTTFMETIEIIRKDGTGARALVAATTFGPLNRNHFFSPAWSADGLSIAFIRDDFLRGEFTIYTINADGTGLRQIVNDLTLFPQRLEWSSRGELAFTCQVPGTGAGLVTTGGICVRSTGGFITKLRIVVPYEANPGLENVANVISMSWSPDGQGLVLVGKYPTATPEGRHFVNHSEVFRVHKDGTGLVQVTNSDDTCPGMGLNGGSTTGASSAEITYTTAIPSPDDKTIIAFETRNIIVNTHDTICDLVGRSHWSALHGSDAPQILSLPPTLGANPAWQPLPRSLTFDISDGHGNPLKGMRVQLQRTDQTLIDDQPTNTTGGTYVFEDTLPIGDYIIRGMLVDRCVDPCQPSFDIHYTPEPNDAVWVDWRFTFDPTQTAPYNLAFDAADPRTVNWSIPADAVLRLPDMANIYFRTRQYVDWVKMRVTPDTGPTVHYYTFATSDPVSGDAVKAKDAYYIESRIVFGVLESEFATRSGVSDSVHDNDAPLNGEWHEFTHHLFRKNISSTPCDDVDPHAGYNNGDTCFSLSEGFSDFLATLAGEEVLNTGSFYNTSSLELPWKAWDSNNEEIAVAALLWDLVARSGNTEDSWVIRNGQPQPFFVKYTNNVPSMSIRQLWNQLTTAHPGTVFDLRKSFGDPDLTIDLERDGVIDVAPIDIPFLIHGFYPVDTEQARLGQNAPTYYDVGYAQRANPGARRDAAIGGTGHYAYDETPARPLIPRNKRVPNPHANVSLTVLDVLGGSLDGATAKVTLTYPGGQATHRELLGHGSGALVHLELPSYFNYPLFGALPPCDPAHDFRVSVVIRVEKDGQVSSDAPSFDNCTYLHAVAAATGPAALAFTVRVPVTGGGDIFPPMTSIALAPQPNAAGWNNQNVTVALSAIDNGTSGVKQTTFSTSGAQVTSVTVVPGATATVPVTTEGQTMVSYFAIDNAGNVESPNALAVQIDKTGPVVTFLGNAGRYTVDQTVSIACDAIDPAAANGAAGSGVASTTCSTLNAPAYSFAPGANAISASAIDLAGNTGGGSTTFTVQVTAGSLCLLTKQFVESSPRFAALPPALRTRLDALLAALCEHLAAMTRPPTPAQKARAMAAYQAGVTSLASAGWLTSSQAATLIGWSKAL